MSKAAPFTSPEVLATMRSKLTRLARQKSIHSQIEAAHAEWSAAVGAARRIQEWVDDPENALAMDFRLLSLAGVPNLPTAPSKVTLRHGSFSSAFGAKC